MTTNRPVRDWGKLLGDEPTATAIFDCFLHHEEIISVTGDGYRLRERKRAKPSSKEAKAPTGSNAKDTRKKASDS